MSEIIPASSESKLVVPSPKEELTFRSGNAVDFGFIDELQKRYNQNLGFMPTMWLEGKANAGHILIAQIDGKPVGYIIAQDKYMKREELGIVYQIAVKPGRQRGFIGAALLKAQFDRSAYGCRLYCCWCAQDIEANRFWESMGFVPLAYRNGAEKNRRVGKSQSNARVHIFWEKKIRGNNDSCHWWYPCKTDQGAMRADRIALPVPPGVDWRDLKPIEIPGVTDQPKLVDQTKEQRSRIKKIKPIIPRTTQWGADLCDPIPVTKTNEPEVLIDRPKRAKNPKIKIDPQFISKSRELRDRYLEQVNEHGYKLESAGKYDLTRQVGESASRKDDSPRLADLPTRRLLEAA